MLLLHPLAALVTCAACGAPCAGQTVRTARGACRYYLCRRRRGACSGPAVNADELEQAIKEELGARQLRPATRASLRAAEAGRLLRAAPLTAFTPAEFTELCRRFVVRVELAGTSARPRAVVTLLCTGAARTRAA